MTTFSLLRDAFSRARMALAAGILLLAGPMVAQSTGFIAGRVSDAATGKSLQGAVVRAHG